MRRITTAIPAITVAGVLVSFLVTNSMIPTTFMIAQSKPTSSLSDSGGVLGHVTYVVRGPDGHIKAYAQTDNTRTVRGINCVFNAVFSPSTVNFTAGNASGSGKSSCDLGRIGSFTGYTVIGLINGSGTVTLNGSDTYTLSKIGGIRASSKDGLIPVTAAANEGAPAAASSVAATSGVYNGVTITSPAFAFSNLASAGTTVRGSMLLNATGGTPSVFAENVLSPTVTVGSGDTLTVTWSITLT